MQSAPSVLQTGFSLSGEVPGYEERRDGDRVVTILRVGVLVVEGRRELCLIRNVSAGGLKAHVYSAVAVGQSVAIEFKSNEQTAGRVVWVEDGEAGIAFEKRVDVAELLANPARLRNGWKPRLPRVEIDRLGTLRVGARTYWVVARDISQGGVRLEIDQPLDAGEQAVITLDRFRPLAGTIRWQRGRHCGVRFNAAVPFDELIEWLRQPA